MRSCTNSYDSDRDAPLCEERHDSRGGSSDPRVCVQGFLVGLGTGGSGSNKFCRAVHEQWSQDIFEVTRQTYRLEAELRRLQKQAQSLDSRVNGYERKIRMLEEENEDLRREACDVRDILHQVVAERELSGDRKVS